MTDTGLNSRLETFLILAKTSKGLGCAKIIKDATEDSSIYTFTELLESPNIAALENSEEYAKNYEVLKLFAYGTYQDYKNSPDKYIPLSEKQLIKLKLLSLVTLSSQSKILKYDSLLEYLDIPNVRELEDLLINAIYQNIIHGKLDQRNKQVDIEYTMSRDLEAKQIIYIKNILSNWLNTSETVIEKLDQEIARIDKEVSAKITIQEKYDNDITDLIKRYKLEAINDAELKFKNSITKKDKMKQPY
ncbi:hypothetical protein LY90DRAFT_461456 [Neocallimastix californiae]|jgi:COP9 signalosome complex subunit 7|uniref:PCI domain-containing protein n=1 Tax=Neocallimastix californiae TaxID=1754190 RepID=A0A1Y2AVK6_9FUNG|nr:hypothetical protein LY90DRAFT_461456 [Neocallimastix californiae]|eukprot:ORY26562.1 hypothetical protein LY90DRAFT_461456 [Neocallimastix californiae]